MEMAKRVPFAFSWADEVESAEREEEQSAAQEPLVDERSSRKPNPFGAARPREVVLEERGVNWRKIDRDLNHSSNLKKEKKLKENIPTANASVNRHEHIPLGQKYSALSNTHNPIPQTMAHYVHSEQQKQGTSGPVPQTMAHYVHSEQQKQGTTGPVPPLRYPPKSIGALMEEMQRVRRRDKFNIDQENFHQSRYPCEFDGVREREPGNYKRRAPSLSINELMGHWPKDMAHSMKKGVNANLERSHMGGFTSHAGVLSNTHLISARKNLELETRRGEQFTKRFTDATQEMHLIGRRQVLVDMNVERINHQGRFMKGEDWEYMEDGGGKRKDLVFPPSGPHEWKNSYKDCSIKRGRIEDGFEDGGLRSAAAAIEYRRRNVGNLVVHSTKAVADREKARKDQHEPNTEVKGNACNNKKRRGMESGPNIAPCRRRRQRKHVKM